MELIDARIHLGLGGGYLGLELGRPPARNGARGIDREEYSAGGFVEDGLCQPSSSDHVLLAFNGDLNLLRLDSQRQGERHFR